MCSEGRITAFMCGSSPRHHHVLHINPSLQVGNLDVAVTDLLFGALNFETFFCCLSVDKDSLVFGENVMF